ncbi:MAG TPA: sodium/glutamate symporter [Verrucomicrobiota bacterium]|jgi:ESS family glutamate:Na+ symporter|nr:sodium/glutamate symporter [Verrucomicrobiota bacterium]HQL76676.1 sodium/glutamate symporter [Verrucomicrobiota bacterium]
MTIPALFVVLLAIPVLLSGEFLVKRIRLLSRFNIPAPVVGGLLVSLLVLLGNLSGAFAAQFQTNVTARWWTWLVTAEIDWVNAPSKNVNTPFLVAFFTCIGLNARWELVRRGGVQVLLFWGAAGVLAVMQNGIGVALAKLLDVSPLLGLACGSVTMTGGHGTALGFAADLEKAGLPTAAVVGMAAATFGLVSGGLIGGPVGGSLIRRRNLKPGTSAQIHLEAGSAGASGILKDLRLLAGFGRPFLAHLLLLLACIKAGAWVSYFIQQTGLTFPVYMGAMLLGVGVRNLLDASRRPWADSEIIDTLAAVSLGVFLAIAMMSLNLIELANTALPMLIILAVQVVVMALYAWFVTFRLMGRDFEAAVMAGGHCGFGLGATPNAVANMKALVESFGPAPRAFLVVPVVGAFLIDFVNALNITFFINLLK